MISLEERAAIRRLSAGSGWATATHVVGRTGADTGPGAGHRAVNRGVFNSACTEYQGCLDPGRAAAREPSSSDLQHADGSQKGYVPKSEC